MRRTQREISAREFQEWQEYYKQEPFGDDWEQAGTIAATNVNLWSKRKVTPRQFQPGGQVKRKKTPQQIEAELTHFARLHNAKVAARQKNGK